MMTDPSLRARLLSGELLQGAFLFLGSPDAAEVMAIAGYGALIVDLEHVSADRSSALAQLRAIQSVSQMSALVRLDLEHIGDAKAMLDAGFEGIVVADVRSAADARRIIEASHYPPLGLRGAQFTISRASRYGADAEGYVSSARIGTLVVAMIESREGFDNIEAIAAIEGIDMLFLGPLDLTRCFGLFGDLASPELRAGLGAAEDRIRATGKLLGGAALDPTDFAEMRARGYALVTTASDAGLLAAAARRAVQCSSR